MKRFTLSAFSVLLAVTAISVGEGFVNAPAAQALPKADADFNLHQLRLREFDARNKSEVKSEVKPAFKLQTLRLRELDIRNKAEESTQPYYSKPSISQPSTQTWTQEVTTEQESTQTAEPTEWQTPEAQEEDASPVISITERRQQSLDRS